MTDSERINQGIREAKARGVKTYTIPPKNPASADGIYHLDAPIVLPSVFTLLLCNCTLRLEDDVYANMIVTEGAFEPHLTKADELRDIRVIGIGKAVLDGGKPNDLTEKTAGKDGRPSVLKNCPILFRNVNGAVVEHLTLKNQRYWGITMYYCRNGRISDIAFYADNSMPNQDGVDLRVGCEYFDVSDITGWTGDDSVALTALPLGEKNASMLVEGKSPDIHDIDIARVSTYISGGHQTVRLLNHDGAKLYNIGIYDITDMALEGKKPARATVVIGDDHYYQQRPAAPGETDRIEVRNVDSHAKVALEVRWNNVTNLTYANIENPDYQKVVFAEKVR